ERVGMAVVELETAYFTTSFAAIVVVRTARGIALEHRATHRGGNVQGGGRRAPRWRRWRGGGVGRGVWRPRWRGVGGSRSYLFSWSVGRGALLSAKLLHKRAQGAKLHVRKIRVRALVAE